MDNPHRANKEKKGFVSQLHRKTININDGEVFSQKFS